MPKHICILCNKEFNRKSNYDYHINNKKKLCTLINKIALQKTVNFPSKSVNLPLEIINDTHITTNDVKNTEHIIDLLLKEPNVDNNNNHEIICIYCEKFFTRTDSLKKHQAGRCKSKVNHDEFEDLKKKMNIIMVNYQHLENENINLKNEIQLIQKEGNNSINKKYIIKTTNKQIINNANNNINNGIINTINIVQFGEENIDKLNLLEAIKQYLISTGGNIVSNMLKYINLNEKYPENHNICITDISRELVKIHNGKKFITKKFKNVKNDIMKNIVKNTKKIMDNYENNSNFKKSSDTKTKLKINEVSLKLIDGVSGEEIVRDEIKEKEQLLNLNNNSTTDINNSKVNNSESDEERDFTLEERLRIEHLDKKRDGLQIKSFENLKDELYNAREFFNEEK